MFKPTKVSYFSQNFIENVIAFSIIFLLKYDTSVGPGAWEHACNKASRCINQQKYHILPQNLIENVVGFSMRFLLKYDTSVASGA